MFFILLLRNQYLMIVTSLVLKLLKDEFKACCLKVQDKILVL